MILGKDGKGTVPHSGASSCCRRLGQQALYDQDRFDEPWDSAHNKQLLAKMPAVFRSPRDAADSTMPRTSASSGRLARGVCQAAARGRGPGGQIAGGEHVPAYSTVFPAPGGADG